MTEHQLAERLGIKTPSPLQVITPNWQGIENYQITVKRDDLIHPIISGNKWRKLKYALLESLNSGVQHILSFGGGYSNHLHALGYCCHDLNIEFTAIVRGDYSQNPSPMLRDLAKWQTKISYVDRKTYQQRTNVDYLHGLQQRYPNAVLIPEGGSWLHAIKGVAEIINELPEQLDHIIAPVASGGTLAGLISASEHYNTHITGIAALKGKDYLEQLVSDLLPHKRNISGKWQINHQHHFGGYAKVTKELIGFINTFKAETGILLDPIYNGKMLFGIYDLMKKGYFKKNTSILAIHTGGLQATSGMNQFLKKKGLPLINI